MVLHLDVVVYVQGFPGVKQPDTNQFYVKISEVLATAGIKWCLAKFQAREYYNAPFSLGSLGGRKLFVPHSEVERTIQVFSHMSDFCIPFRSRHDATLLREFQLFKLTGIVLYFLVFPDTFCVLSPLNDDKFVVPQTTPFPVLYSNTMWREKV